VATTRVIKNAAATISHLWYVGETLTDPSAATYGVRDANGTEVVAAGTSATITGGDSGRTTFSLAAQTTTRLLTVTWSATVSGVARVEVDQVEVVSGFFFSLAEARASDSSLSSSVTYPSSALEVARYETEVECETICDRAFLPRYARIVGNGTGSSTFTIGHPDPYRSLSDFRSLRRISVAPSVDESFVDFTAGELADVAVQPDGTLIRTGGDSFTWGVDNVVVEYEYGLAEPPPDLKRAALMRFRSRLNLHRSGIPDRASSYSVIDGTTFRLDMPGAWKTGIPDVDAVYRRYSRREQADGKPRPASRTLDFNPQYYSLFHGGRR
jgi:hypothetical protein